MKLIKYIAPVLFLLTNCSTDQTTTAILQNTSKEPCELIEIKTANLSELLDRTDIKQNQYHFDSLYFEWHLDTLLLHHAFNVSNTCADYSLSVEEKGDTLVIDFIDETNCDLATIIEMKAKIFFREKESHSIVKYKNHVLTKQSGSENEK